MTRVHFRPFLALTLALSFLFPAEVVTAHTGYPPIPIFTFKTHPDFPMEDFVAGHLGVILPTYEPRFLYAAYRNLTGKNFTAAEIRTMKRDWEPLFNGRFNFSVAYNGQDATWRDKWFRFRLSSGKNASSQSEFLKKVREESYLHKDGHYVFFENCAEDAFQNAFRTLLARERKFGKQSTVVRNWLAAQDQVFANCTDEDRLAGPQVPAPASDSEPLLTRQDRAYQIAAAHFYRGDFSEAQSEFEAIAKDSRSPWSGIAPYLAARSLLRKAQFEAPKGQPFAINILKESATAFRAVITDNSRMQWRDPARNLLRFVEIRLNPSATCSELATRLKTRGALSGSAQVLTDYLYLINQDREDSTLPAQICSNDDDLTDWILTFSDPAPNSFSHAYHQWKKTGAQHWLLAALATALKENSETEELLTAATNIPHTSPAYWTVRFYRERLLIQKEQLELARHELDDDLEHSAGLANPLNQSSKNLFLSLRARAAANLDDFLRSAVRTPSTLVYIDEYNTKLTDDDKDPRDAYMRQQYASAHFDDDAGAVLNNYLSLPQLLKAAQNHSLPSNVRRDVALMAFTRAVVTENKTAADQIARVAIPAAPDVADGLKAFITASNKQQKDFAAVWLILHHPEMQPALETGTTRATAAGKIDCFQDNWWAHFKFDPADEQDPDFSYYLHWWNRLPDHLKSVFPEGEIPPPAFVSKTDLDAARNDWQKLEQLPLAGDWLAGRTLQFARSNSTDPRIPEALHLAIRATRFGYTAPRTPNYSKQAFQLLHKKYPDSEWTKKTPYWF